MMNASCSRCYLNPTLTQPPGGTQFTIGKSHLCICYINIYMIYMYSGTPLERPGMSH